MSLSGAALKDSLAQGAMVGRAATAKAGVRIHTVVALYQMVA